MFYDILGWMIWKYVFIVMEVVLCYEEVEFLIVNEVLVGKSFIGLIWGMSLWVWLISCL